jgi:predicted anti-sigma-YlaC factor YlaD
MTRLLALLAVLAMLNACAVRQYAVNRIGDALAGGGASFAADDDPELVRAAAPFSLKLIESLLEESPRHAGLLLAAARGFTQYAYAFVQQDAEEAEDHDLARSLRLQARARGLYRRARDYGLRGLALQPGDVALHYWTGAAWGALIALSKHEPEALADLPRVEALIGRALELDETFEHGALHTFMIGYEMARPGAGGEAEARARRHFARAHELSSGLDAAPLVALAEGLCVPRQRRAEFEQLLGRALAIDPGRRPDGRLANLVAQRRARWLMARAERLFLD